MNYLRVKSGVICLSIIFGFTPIEVQSQLDYPDFTGEPFFVLNNEGLSLRIGGLSSQYIANSLSHIGIEVIENQFVSQQGRVYGFIPDITPIYDEGGFDISTNLGIFFTSNFGGEVCDCLTSLSNLFNSWGFTNPNFIRLYEQLYSAWTESEQTEAYDEFFQFIGSELPYIPIGKFSSVLVYDKKLKLDEQQISGLGNTQQDPSVFSKGWAELINPDSNRLIIGYNILGAPPLIPHFYRQLILRNNFYFPSLVFQSLYERDYRSDYAWNPLLTEGMPVLSASKMNATVKIRTDVVFADGNPLTAVDVVESYRMHGTIGSNGYSNLFNLIDGVDGIKLVDNYTVQFDFQRPDPYFMEVMKVGIVPTHAWGNYTSALSRNQIQNQLIIDLLNSSISTYGFGTGPFIYANLTDSFTGDLQLNANNNYWGGKVNLEEIYFKNYLDNEDEALSDLENGLTDILLNSVISNITKVEEKNLPFQRSANNVDWGLAINHNHPIIGTGVETPLGIRDPSRAAEAARYVRQAINYAIPRQDVAKKYGFISVTTNPLPEEHRFFIADDTPKHNFTIARSFMELAGYKFTEEGVSVPLNTTSSTFEIITPPKVSFALNSFVISLLLIVMYKRIYLNRRVAL